MAWQEDRSSTVLECSLAAGFRSDRTAMPVMYEDPYLYVVLCFARSW